MDLSLIFDQVEKHFGYLINQYGFSVLSKKLYSSFDNTEIVLQSEEYQIRVLRERGQIFVDIGPAPPSKEWYDLATLIAYLTKGTEQLEYKVPEIDGYDAQIEWQVERLAGILQKHLTQIFELFRKGTFEEKRADLKEFINSRQ